MSENINMGGEFYSAIIGEKSTGVYKEKVRFMSMLIILLITSLPE